MRTAERSRRLHDRLRRISVGTLRTTREVSRRPTGLLGMVLVAGFVTSALLCSVIAPYDPNGQDLSHRLAGPSLSHILGTDELGRDLLSRILYGSRVSLMVAALAVGFAVIVGLALGLAGGYLGGVPDVVVVTVTDALQAFPALVLGLALLAATGPSTRNLVIVIAFAFIPNYVRMARATTLSLKPRPFVLAQRALGAKPTYVMRRHLVPNVIPPLLVLIAIDLSIAIIIEAGLSFLGLGVQPPTPSWGGILFDGFQYIRLTPWAVVWAGFALMLATFGFTFISETLRDVFDPRLASQHEGRTV